MEPISAIKQLKKDISIWNVDAKNTTRMITANEISKSVGWDENDYWCHFHIYDFNY